MSTNINALKEFVIMVCKEKMNIEVPDKIDESESIGDVFNLDSISTYELILNLEEQYSKKVDDDDIEKVSGMSLQELSNFFSPELAEA